MKILVVLALISTLALGNLVEDEATASPRHGNSGAVDVHMIRLGGRSVNDADDLVDVPRIKLLVVSNVPNFTDYNASAAASHQRRDYVVYEYVIDEFSGADEMPRDMEAMLPNHADVMHEINNV